jgi:hypothetical protein
VGAPPDAAERVFDLSTEVSREAVRIGDDLSASADARKASLAALAQQTRQQIRTLLGDEGSAAYLRTIEDALVALEQGHIVEFGVGSRSVRSIQSRPSPERSGP